MTERDPSSNGFLERWSRKKIEAKIEAKAEAKIEARRDGSEAPAAPGIADALPPGLSEQPMADAERPAPVAPAPEFDLTHLPSLESITAATDIRGFLSPGVPKELARAALRRAWAADPAIRDFVGLAENAWDFTDPTAMPGFGPLPPGYDVKQLVAQIFSGSEKPADLATLASKPADLQAEHIAEEIAAPTAPPAATQATEESTEGDVADVSVGEQQTAQSDFVQRGNNIAMHKGISDDDTEEPQNRRQHGGALPQ